MPKTHKSNVVFWVAFTEPNKLMFTPLSPLSLYIPSQPQRFSSSSQRGYSLHVICYWGFYQRVQEQVGWVFSLGWHWGHCADSLTCVLVEKFNNIPESTVAAAGNSVFSTHEAQRNLSAPCAKFHRLTDQKDLFKNQGQRMTWMLQPTRPNSRLPAGYTFYFVFTQIYQSSWHQW